MAQEEQGNGKEGTGKINTNKLCRNVIMKHYILLEFLKSQVWWCAHLIFTWEVETGRNRGFKVVPGYTVSLGSARAP